MFALTLAATALSLSAPPPKPYDKTGRITFWIGDKVESFLPDGTDRTTMPAPMPMGDVISFVPKRRLAVQLKSRSNGRNVDSDWSDYTIVINPLDAYGTQYTLNGYVVLNYIPSVDGSKIYFNGCEGERVDRRRYKGFVLDLETRKVEPVPLPENHQLKAVSPDGRTFITLKGRQFLDEKRDFGVEAQSQTYLISDGGTPVELLKENTLMFPPKFSANGSKAIMTTLTPQIPGQPSQWEIVVLDVATRMAKSVRDLPPGGAYALSPDGTKCACLWFSEKKAAGLPGGPQYEPKVFVADLNGCNQKVVYKAYVKVADMVPDSYAHVFQWK
jgi:hypothetical protein